jgi:hypothetical protein
VQHGHARTYLRPALKRPNLQLVTHALVHRILFDSRRARREHCALRGIDLRCRAGRLGPDQGGSAGSSGGRHVVADQPVTIPNCARALAYRLARCRRLDHADGRSGNTNAAAITIGERAADILQQNLRLAG